jgi:hypothetical protein
MENLPTMDLSSSIRHLQNILTEEMELELAVWFNQYLLNNNSTGGTYMKGRLAHHCSSRNGQLFSFHWLHQFYFQNFTLILDGAIKSLNLGFTTCVTYTRVKYHSLNIDRPKSITFSSTGKGRHTKESENAKCHYYCY